ncbi:MAG: glycosyltransferase [gamma proteobacterium symbiont of Taylorina sp.]|nr:glycosyltransferase [gamma proteobacterium symbiont of Taylorina sp.]
MKKNIILFVGHLWPEPTSSAAGYRTLALLKALSAQWQVHFACAAEKTEYCADLESLNILEHKIKLNHSSFDHFISVLQPDIVFYDRFISEEQFAPRIHKHCPDVINILDTQDLHFLRKARQKTLNSQQKINLHSEEAIREIAAILRCDLSLIISSYEMRLLIKQFNISSSLIHFCPFMLSTENNEPADNFDEREHFIMIGNFLHPPNWDAVLWCYQFIWPKIRQRLPEAQIHIYGAYATEKVRQLHQPDKGFMIKGRAEDAVKTLSQYRVNLVPLRFGAGIKGKIADGFIAGTPCITTDIGQEGMADDLPWGDMLANDEEQITEKAVQLYTNQSLWKQCRQFGHHIIKQNFNEKQHSEALIKHIHQLENKLSEHRDKNFYGQILRHNLYRSQYFMSKWIEEKNNNQ